MILNMMILCRQACDGTLDPCSFIKNMLTGILMSFDVCGDVALAYERTRIDTSKMTTFDVVFAYVAAALLWYVAFVGFGVDVIRGLARWMDPPEKNQTKYREHLKATSIFAYGPCCFCYIAILETMSEEVNREENGDVDYVYWWPDASHVVGALSEDLLGIVVLLALRVKEGEAWTVVEIISLIGSLLGVVARIASGLGFLEVQNRAEGAQSAVEAGSALVEGA